MVVVLLLVVGRYGRRRRNASSSSSYTGHGRGTLEEVVVIMVVEAAVAVGVRFQGFGLRTIATRHPQPYTVNPKPASSSPVLKNAHRPRHDHFQPPPGSL